MRICGAAHRHRRPGSHPRTATTPGGAPPAGGTPHRSRVRWSERLLVPPKETPTHMQTTLHTPAHTDVAASRLERLRAARLPRVTASALALGSIGVVALHVADDSFLHPEPGTSALDHPAAIVPLALLGLAAYGYRRGRAGLRASIALVVGLLALVIGVASAGFETITVGPSGDDFTGLLALPAGLALIGVGLVTLWRSRKLDDRKAWRYTRRGLLAVAAAIVVNFVLFPLGFSYVITHVMRQTVPAPTLGADYENVSLHDERRPRAPGLVRALQERCRRDRLPGPKRPAGAHTHARPPRLRRPPLRPPRRRPQRGRQQPPRLGRRQGHPRRGRVPRRAARTSTPTGSAGSASRSEAS